MSNSEFSPTYVTFLFFRLDPAFKREPGAAKQAAVEAFLGLTGAQDGFEARVYSTLGLKHTCDFLVWVIAKKLEVVPAYLGRINRSALGASLTLAHSYTAVTKPTPYSASHAQAFELGPPFHKYVVVYPFTKTDAWYQLPFDERRRMMEEHRKVGEKFPMVRINTTYSFGLGDQDFMLAFECDEPKDFSDLVQALRETKGRVYTKEDTPFFVCLRAPADEILRAVVGL
jgi:chlorite dismutase